MEGVEGCEVALGEFGTAYLRPSDWSRGRRSRFPTSSQGRFLGPREPSTIILH
jgi:hypothetical protein